MTIAGAHLRMLMRDRTNLLFVFALPLLLVFVLGAVSSGYQPRLGLVVEEPDDVLAAELAAEIEGLDGVDVERFDDEGEALDRLRRDDLDGLVVVPAGHGNALRAGEASNVRFVAAPDEGFVMRGLLDGAVARQSARVRAALTAVALDLAPFDDGIELAAGLQATPSVTVEVVDPAGRVWEERVRETDQMAAQQLVLFTFITALTAGTVLIQSRQLGVIRRMLATPTPVGTIVTGETAARYLITVGQGTFIAVATMLLFGVRWGSWAATLAVMLLFGLAGVGAGLLLGVLSHNESQAGGLAIVLGLGLAALGGSMVPLEIFPDSVRTIAHLTPHAWANDAFSTVVQGGGGLADITGELGVLAAYGAALVGLATALMRWRISREGPGR